MIRALARVYAALWAATAAGAALAAIGLPVIEIAAPHDALDETIATALGLLAHNAVVALWPLALVALDWPALPGARRVGDALIAAQLLAHGLLVGAALGSHADMWRFLPHLPLEWLGLAIPAAGWLAARRRRGLAPARTLAAAAAAVGALAAAALLETHLVPL